MALNLTVTRASQSLRLTVMKGVGPRGMAGSGQAAVTVADAAARKDAASYTGTQLEVGALKVKQTDMPGVLWFLIAADVTLDASWFAAADAGAAGVRIYNTTTATFYTLTLTGAATEEYLTWTPEV